MKKVFTPICMLATMWTFSQQSPYTNFEGSIDLSSINLAGISSSINEADGSPNIEIPLFEISSGDIKYPITLIYDAKGIKVDQRSSNVGLGWSLFSSIIKRDVVDGLDLDDNDGSFGPKRVGFRTRVLNNTKYKLTSTSPPNNDLLLVDEFPDIFTFISPKRQSHNFYVHPVDGYKLLTSERILVNPTVESHSEISGSPNYLSTDFYKFSIKDESGITYSFNDTEACNIQNLENYYNESGSILNSLPVISNWKISNIKDRKGHELYFQYTTAPNYSKQKFYNGREINSGYYSQYKLNNSIFKGFYFDILFGTSFVNGYDLKGFWDSSPTRIFPIATTPSYSFKSITEATNYSRLSNLEFIHFDMGYIKIEYNQTRLDSQTNEKAISSVGLYNKNNVIIKKYDFTYSYFQANDLVNLLEHDHTQRLRLDKIDGGFGEVYEFTYNNNPLPSLNSKAFDYGGYYNGTNEMEGSTIMSDEVYYYPNQKEWSLLPFTFPDEDYQGNQYNLPKHIIKYGDNGITREPNEALAKSGVLIEIKNPFKGKQKFEYELNTFRMHYRESKAPGLRVKEIKLLDNEGAEYITRYKYLEQDGGSSGRMLLPPMVGYPKAKLFSAEVSTDPYSPGIISNYNGLPNFYSDHLYKLFKVVDRPSSTIINYNRVIKIDPDQGKTISEYKTNEDLNFGMGSSFHTPIALADRFENPGQMAFHHLNFADFLRSNSSYSLRYRTPIVKNLIGKLTKQSLYDSQDNLLTTKVISYRNIFPNSIYSANHYFDKPFFNKTVTATYSTSSNHEYSSQGSIFVPYFYNNQIIEFVDTTEYTPSGNVFTKLKYGHWMNNEHSMPTTHFFTTDYDGKINGTFNLYDNLFNSHAVNQNIQTGSTGRASFKGYDILDDYERPMTLQESFDTQFTADSSTSNLFLPKKNLHTIRQTNNSLVLNTEIENFDKYDNKGNLIQFSKFSKPTTTIYGYNQTLPIAIIEGITYSDLMQALNLPVTNIGYLDLDIVLKSNEDISIPTEDLLLNALESFRKNDALKNVLVTTYTYDPLIGITSQTLPSGSRLFYIYGKNRLKELREENRSGNIVQEYDFNIKD